MEPTTSHITEDHTTDWNLLHVSIHAIANTLLLISFARAQFQSSICVYCLVFMP